MYQKRTRWVDEQGGVLISPCFMSKSSFDVFTMSVVFFFPNRLSRSLDSCSSLNTTVVIFQVEYDSLMKYSVLYCYRNTIIFVSWRFSSLAFTHRLHRYVWWLHSVFFPLFSFRILRYLFLTFDSSSRIFYTLTRYLLDVKSEVFVLYVHP